jgi:hypothetical protein
MDEEKGVEGCGGFYYHSVEFVRGGRVEGRKGMLGPEGTALSIRPFSADDIFLGEEEVEADR